MDVESGAQFCTSECDTAIRFLMGCIFSLQFWAFKREALRLKLSDRNSVSEAPDCLGNNVDSENLIESGESYKNLFDG